ncbi:sporulation protein Cse60 [Bacillus manliponensis]
MTEGDSSMIRVKMFDESHEKDLEDAMNTFLKKLEDNQLVDIKYQVGVAINDDENQIYCFSAMVVYKDKL